MPPQPPGVPAADLSQRQLWWLATVVATAIGLWLLVGERRPWPLRLAGIACLGLPHLIGAPTAPAPSPVPAQLLRQFTIASVATTGFFWLLVGTIGGYIYRRQLRA